MNNKINKIKLIKRSERETPEAPAEMEPIADENRWTDAVRTWVREFQHHERSAAPAFDRLFKDASA